MVTRVADLIRQLNLSKLAEAEARDMRGVLLKNEELEVLLKFAVAAHDTNTSVTQKSEAEARGRLESLGGGRGTARAGQLDFSGLTPWPEEPGGTILEARLKPL